MIIKLLVYKILQLLFMMVIGFILAKFKIISDKESEVLSKLSLYLLIPSAIINAFNFKSTSELRIGLLFAFAVAIVIHIILLFLDRLYIMLLGNNPVERASVMYSNAGSLIIPIVTSVLGKEWVVYSTAYLSVQIFFIWTHGIRIFSADTKFNIRKILCNINIIAIMLGIVMLFLGLRFPKFLTEITVSFGDMVAPIGMIIAGFLASKINLRKVIKNKSIYTTAIVRLIVYPMVCFLVIKILSNIPIVNGKEILFISLLACIAPSASTVMCFAQIKQNNSELAVEINIFTTICSMITIPVIVFLYELFC